MSRYVGPFEALDHVSKVTYQLELLASMDNIHNIFHVSLLYKYISDSTDVLRVMDVKLKDNLVYNKCPIQILDK